MIYRQFAEHTEDFLIDEAPSDIKYATIGVDFGGNKSAHSFKLTGYTQGFKQIITLDEYYKKQSITPAQLTDDFIDFVKRSQAKYKVYEAYCDSAETTLINGLTAACIRTGTAIDVKNAIKGNVNNRIAFYNSMMAQGRYKIMRHCEHLIKAFQSAVYDEKVKTKDERLDDGIMDIDSLDSQEYSTESVQNDIMYL